MSRIETKTGSQRYIANGTTGNSNISISNGSNAYKGCESGEYSSTSYAQLTVTRNTTGYTYYTFDTSA